jgi:D-alanine-D-alanine ligase-like ATP-grasp enzyme
LEFIQRKTTFATPASALRIGRAGRRGKEYENEKKLSIQFYVIFPKCKKVYGADGALPGYLHLRAGRFRQRSTAPDHHIRCSGRLHCPGV